MKKMNNKGFTLMEMLIVVAIIAVLVAIAIPVFTNQLEKAREATDEANVRSAYAEVMACALTDSADKTNGVKRATADTGVVTWSKGVKAVQKQANWQSVGTDDGKVTIGGQEVEASTDGWTITYTEGTDNATIKTGYTDTSK